MSGKNLALSITIGAALASSFKSVMGQSVAQFDQLGATVKKVESQSAQIGTFKRLKTELNSAETAFQQAKSDTANYRRELEQSKQSSKQLGVAIKKTNGELEDSQAKYSAAKANLAAMTAHMPKGKKRTDGMRQALERARAEIDKNKASVTQHKQTLTQYNKTLKQSQTEQTQFKNKVGQSQQSVHVLSQKLEQSRRTLTSHRQAMNAAGVSTSKLIHQEKKLGQTNRHQTQAPICPA